MFQNPSPGTAGNVPGSWAGATTSAIYVGAGERGEGDKQESGFALTEHHGNWFLYTLNFRKRAPEQGQHTHQRDNLRT